MTSIAEEQFEQLLWGFRERRGCRATICLVDAQGANHILDAITSELTSEQVIMFGGFGNLGGFNAMVRAKDVKNIGGVFDEMAGVDYPHLAANVTTTGTEASRLSFTAVTFGEEGNECTVTLTNPGTNNAALAATFRGRDVTVSLATNGAAAATSTAAQVMAAVNALTGAPVIADLSDGTGLGVAVAEVLILTGGEGATRYLKRFTQTNQAIYELTFVDSNTQ